MAKRRVVTVPSGYDILRAEVTEMADLTVQVDVGNVKEAVRKRWLPGLFNQGDLREFLREKLSDEDWLDPEAISVRSVQLGHATEKAFYERLSETEQRQVQRTLQKLEQKRVGSGWDVYVSSFRYDPESELFEYHRSVHDPDAGTSTESWNCYALETTIDEKAPPAS